jgi:uncharacterized Zn-finger protein
MTFDLSSIYCGHPSLHSVVFGQYFFVLSFFQFLLDLLQNRTNFYSSAPVPAQAAIQSTFDMDQHINRMIRETSLAAGPIHQNQILQQMVLNQSIQAGITSQNQPMINQPSCHTVVPNKTNQPSPQIVSESKDQQYHINQPKTSPITLGNDQLMWIAVDDLHFVL